MQNRFKNVLLDRMLEAIEEEKNIGLTVAQKRNICNLLAYTVSTVHEENFQKMNRSHLPPRFHRLKLL